MMKKILLALSVSVAILGCGPDSGTVSDESLQNAKLKSVDQLPTDMPPQARASAASAMGQAGVQQSEAKARANAMAEMAKQRGR